MDGHRDCMDRLAKINSNLPSKGFIVFWFGAVPLLAGLALAIVGLI